MGRQFIKVNQDITKENGELKLEPVDSIETPDTRVEGDRGNKAEKPTYLGTHLKIAKKFHRVFMSRLSELIKQTMLKSKPNTPIFEKILGFSNIDSKRREFISQLMQYDADKKQIKNIRFSLLENGGDLGKFDEFVFGGHIAEVVGPTLGQMVNLSSKNRSLSGFSLLQKLTLKASEISPERGEATASYQLDPKGPVYTTRFDYDPNVTIELPLKEQTKLQTVRVSTLSIPELGIILYTLQDPKSGSAPGDQIIVAIKSTSISKLTGLCGLTEDELSAQIGPTAIDKIDQSRLDRTGTDSGFKEALLAALEVKRKSKPDFKCNYIAPNDSTGLDRERKLIFPDQSVAIDFSLRDLSSFTLYATVDEVFKK